MNAPFIASYVALWILVLLVTIVVIVTVRQLGVLNLRLGGRMAMELPAGPRIGERAPEFTSHDTKGRIARPSWVQGRPSLLIFISPQCSSCRELMPSIRAIRRSDRRQIDILLVSNAASESNQEYARRSLCQVLVDRDMVAAYAVDATPYGIAVDGDGVVRAKGIVNQIEHLESLLDSLSEPAASDHTKTPYSANEEKMRTERDDGILQLGRD